MEQKFPKSRNGPGLEKELSTRFFVIKRSFSLNASIAYFHEIGENVPEIQNEIDPLKKLLNRAYYFGHFQSHLIEMLNLIRGAALKGNPQVQEKLDEVIKEPHRADPERSGNGHPSREDQISGQQTSCSFAYGCR